MASFYDQLARLVFGETIFSAQTSHFDSILKDSKVLIVGGGTGWILQQLPEHCKEVTYVEPSGKMMKIANQRQGTIPIRFIQKPIQEIHLENNYDVIITNFFFDLFDELQGYEIGLMLSGSLKRNGIWIITDFENGGKWWQKIMLNLMYFFFTLATGMGNRDLPEWKGIMSKLKMQQISSNQYFGKFISSIRYQSQKLSV